jgi:hypothetical protein
MENLKNSNSGIQASQGNHNQGSGTWERIQQLINDRNRKMDLIKSTSEEIRGLDRQISDLRKSLAPVEKKQEIA